MVGWHHWLDGHQLEQAPGIGDGQEGLAHCSPWGHKVGHDWVTELNWWSTHFTHRQHQPVQWPYPVVHWACQVLIIFHKHFQELLPTLDKRGGTTDANILLVLWTEYVVTVALKMLLAAVYPRLLDFHVKQGQGCLPFLCPWRVERVDKKTLWSFKGSPIRRWLFEFQVQYLSLLNISRSGYSL